MKWKKPLVIILVLVMVVPMFTSGLMAVSGLSAVDAAQENNSRIAEELSDLTGMEKEEILDLKSVLGSWEAVVSYIEKGTEMSASSDVGADILLSFASDEEIKGSLIKKGYNEESIDKALADVQRLESLLIEYSRSANNTANDQSIDSIQNSDILKIAESFDKEIAVKFILDIEAIFEMDEKGFEKSPLDIYLACLENDIDIEKVFTEDYDMNQFLEENSSVISLGLTLEDIEYAVIEALMAYQANQNVSSDGAQSKSDDLHLNDSVIEPVIPDPSKDILGSTSEEAPLSPQERVMSEVISLNPNLSNE